MPTDPIQVARTLIIVAALSVSSVLEAQRTQVFDQLQFRTPPGQREERPDVVTFTHVTARAFCRVSIYKGVPSSGDPAADFRAEWDAMRVARGTDDQAPTPRSAPAPEGWVRLEADGTGKAPAGGSFAVRHLVYSGRGTRTSALLLFSDAATCQRSNEDFWSSITLAGAPVVTGGGRRTDPPEKAPEKAPVTPTANTAPPATGYAFTSTNFDDGWTASPQADYVQLTSGPTAASLHYSYPLDDDARRDVIGTGWQRLIVPRYQVGTVYAREYSALNFPYHLRQADVVDRASGQRRFVTLLIMVESGVASGIEVLTATRNDFETRFPSLEAVQKLAGYNRFAISAGDIVGSWVSNGVGFAEYFNIYTGNSAGLNAATISSRFTFGAGNAFETMHKGATGMVGSQRLFQEATTGRYVATNWELTLIDASGRRNSFLANYQAIRGGRILHLQHAQYSGMQYHLVRRN